MVNRVKTWTPSAIPLRNDLPSWKAICKDVHDNFILAGLVQTADTGQLDIGAVAALTNGTHAGYRMYRFNDPMQALYPVFIKLEFGLSNESLSGGGSSTRSFVPNLKYTVGTNTDGAGNFVGITSNPVYCPQQVYTGTGTATSNNTSPGTSYFCYNEDKGFFGFVYGAGSRNSFMIHSLGGYITSSLTIFIQRTLDVNGIPDDRGVGILGPNLSLIYAASVWDGTAAYPNTSQDFISTTLTSNSNLQTLIGPSGSRAFGAEVGLQPVYMETPYTEQWPSLLTYHYTDIPSGSVIELTGSNLGTFKAIGREIGIIADNKNYWRTAFAMLYEGDEVV